MQLKCLCGWPWAVLRRVSTRFYHPKFCDLLLIRFSPPPQQRATVADWFWTPKVPRQRPTLRLPLQTGGWRGTLPESSQHFEIASEYRYWSLRIQQATEDFPSGLAVAVENFPFLLVLVGRTENALEASRPTHPTCEAETRLVLAKNCPALAPHAGSQQPG